MLEEKILCYIFSIHNNLGGLFNSENMFQVISSVTLHVSNQCGQSKFFYFMYFILLLTVTFPRIYFPMTLFNISHEVLSWWHSG